MHDRFVYQPEASGHHFERATEGEREMIKRYTEIMTPVCTLEMVLSEKGEWCKWEDVEKLINGEHAEVNAYVAALNQQIAALQRHNDELTETVNRLIAKDKIAADLCNDLTVENVGLKEALNKAQQKIQVFEAVDCEAIYLVPTDKTSDDGKHTLYERHEKPVPFADCEKLYDRPARTTCQTYRHKVDPDVGCGECNVGLDVIAKVEALDTRVINGAYLTGPAVMLRRDEVLAILRGAK